MSARAHKLVWLIIAIGFLGRLALAFRTYGVRYDMDSLTAVGKALSVNPLRVYTIVNGDPTNRWPYPPGFLPIVALARAAARATATPFHGWVKLPEILADCACAWLVQDLLGRQRAATRTRLVATALVAFGPAFWMVSGYHGQIDPVSILTAVAALWIWEKWPGADRRAVAAGLLIGVGISMKTVPGLMLFALLPTVRSRREGVTLVMLAAAVPLASVIPFLLVDPHGLFQALRTNRTLPGMGGLSLILQPDLASLWLHGSSVRPDALNRFLFIHQQPITAALVAPSLAVVVIRKVSPVPAAATLYLALVLCVIGFGPQYQVWALPFAMIAGLLWQVALVQAALFVSEAILYWHPFGYAPTDVYVAIMITVWMVLFVVLVVWLVRLWSSPSPGSAVRGPRSGDPRLRALFEPGER